MVGFKDDNDDFWDVAKLVPKQRAPLAQFSSSPKVREVSFEDVEISNENKPHSAKEDRKIDFSVYESNSERRNVREAYSYAPVGNNLLKKVTIKPSLDRFDFYDTFRKAALIYFDYKCPKSAFVPFYSYKPQYSQMTSEQKKYYFYWRDEVRCGRYIKTDYSYIYLYAYEILNLPEKIGKEEGLKLLCDIWIAYRKDLPRIDQSFALWVQDYCLVYELECPFYAIKDFLFDIINASQFKEFYLSDMDKGGNGAAAMIAYLSDYDWRRGKYAGGESADMYRAHIEGAMQLIFMHLLRGDTVDGSNVSKITKTAFAGSLCTHTVKCILEIEYSSIADSPELRSQVTAALKYTENKLRACLGVKSRLAIKELPDSFRKIIDKYFESEFARLKRERERANQPEYERLYDAPEEKVSFADAIEIEKASWKMTARLVEGTENDEELAEASSYIKQTEEISLPEAQNAESDSKTDTYGLSDAEINYLSAAYRNEYGEMRRIVKESGSVEDTFAEKINEAFSDNFGDVVLEDSGDGEYRIIEDYYEEIGEWLQKIMK